MARMKVTAKMKRSMYVYKERRQRMKNRTICMELRPTIKRYLELAVKPPTVRASPPPPSVNRWCVDLSIRSVNPDAGSSRVTNNGDQERKEQLAQLYVSRQLTFILDRMERELDEKRHDVEEMEKERSWNPRGGA